MMVRDLLSGLFAALAYGVTGTALMAVGYTLVDIATPGRLRDLIWVERNRNAAVLLASSLTGVGIIVTTAILVSDDELGRGIAATVGYGLLGLFLMAVAFGLLDLMTPGRLGEVLSQSEPHPAVWVSAAVHVSIAAIIAAAIS